MELSTCYKCLCCIRSTREIWGQEFADLQNIVDVNDYENYQKRRTIANIEEKLGQQHGPLGEQKSSKDR